MVNHTMPDDNALSTESEGFLAELGRYVRAIGRLELLFDEVASYILGGGNHQRGAALLRAHGDGAALGSRIAFLKNFLAAVPDEPIHNREELTDILERANSIVTDRNETLHAAYIQDGEGFKQYGVKTTRAAGISASAPPAVTVTGDTMREARHRCSELTADLAEWWIANALKD